MPADSTLNQLLTTLFESQIALMQAQKQLEKDAEKIKELEGKLEKGESK